jgi:phosphate-selective porin OprO/OprP
MAITTKEARRPGRLAVPGFRFVRRAGLVRPAGVCRCARFQEDLDMDPAERPLARGRRRRTSRAAALAIVAGLACVFTAVRAGAQTPPAEPPGTQPTPEPAVTAGWRDGFVVQSENGDYRLQIGALVQADARFALADENEAVTDMFLLRRLRPYIRGRLAQHFEFFVNPDFAGGTLVVQDAYIDTVFAPAFRLRVGKGKTPFGMERLQSAGNLLFIERAAPTAIAPNRDLGIQALGDIAGGVLSYSAGVLNGVTDGGSADIDASDSKDVAGRLVVRPFAKHAASALHGLSLGIAGTRGRQEGALALPTFRTSLLQQAFFSYIGATADGVRTRYSPQLSFYHKAFAGLVEYAHSELPVRKGLVLEEIGHDAWQIAGAFVLTGEAATDALAGIRPRANFDFGAGHWGAFQAGIRYHELTVDEAAISLNLAAADSSRKAEAWTLGLNWYLTQNFKYVVDFERTVFEGDADGPRKAENALVFRTQVNF